MESNKSHFFEKIETIGHRQYIEEQTNCVLCGSVLELQHIVLDLEYQIREEAFCPHCKVKTRTKTFSIN